MQAIHNKYAPSSFNKIWIANQEHNPEINRNLCNYSLYAVPSSADSIPKALNKLRAIARGQHKNITFL
jgi:hypothetical protein